MTKSKSQEKGVCSECGLSLFLVVKELAVDIKTGKICQLHLRAKCPECKAKFEWTTTTGRITRAKSQSPAKSGTGKKKEVKDE